MAWPPTFSAFLLGCMAGLLIGLALVFIWKRAQTRTTKELAEEIYRQSEAERQAQVNAAIDNLKACFESLSFDALKKSTEEFLKLAQVRWQSEREVGARDLEAKKGLIDQQLQHMTTALENVSQVMRELEKDRVEKFGELSSHLKATGEQTAALLQSTQMLREALASTKARGQWGERMAEDVLRVAGFIEGVNFWKQRTIEGTGSRPDFTFPLPKDLKLNMDVKFPLDNYLRYLEAQSDAERTRFRSDFLRDVKARVKEVTTREYINPEQRTVDCVLLFIPNDQIYAFIHEQDPTLLDEGAKNRVVFCSPMTLFAVLAVIREAVDHFALEQTSSQILGLLGAFRKQWEEYLKVFDRLGKAIEGAQKEFHALTTTRRQKLEKPLLRIEELRRMQGVEIAIAPGETEEGLLPGEDSET